MTKHGVPRVSHADLRDHATEECVERLWKSIEADLGLPEPWSSRSYRPVFAAVFAVLLAFGGGLLVGKYVGRGNVSGGGAGVVRPSEELATTEVLAAGTQGRTFVLPGGGRITLEPGSTVEVVRRESSALSLRLVQGEAAVDTVRASRGQALAILAGEATLSTQAGSVLRVRRNADDMEVSVADGTVQVDSPSGTHSIHRGEYLAAIPIRVIPAAAVPMGPRRVSGVSATRRDVSLALESSEGSGASVAEPHSRSAAGEGSELLAQLRYQAGGIDGAIASARSGQELMDVYDIVWSTGDSVSATKALARIVEAFPDDQYAQVAALKLGDIYRAAGQTELAHAYFGRAHSLKGVLAQDALCKRLRLASNKDDASRMAREYLEKYPDGPCKEDAERIAQGEIGSLEDEESSPDAGASPPAP